MGELNVKNMFDCLKAREIALKEERYQTNLIEILLLCCPLHGTCRSKEEQMAQGRE